VQLGQLQWELNVLQRSQYRNQIEALKNETNVRIAPPGDASIGQALPILAENLLLAVCRRSKVGGL